MGHRDARRFAWLRALLRQAFLATPATIDTVNSNADTKGAVTAETDIVTDTAEYASAGAKYDPALGKDDLKDSLLTLKDTDRRPDRPVTTATSGDYDWDTAGVSTVILNNLGLSDDPEAAAMLKGNTIRNTHLAMIAMLDHYVQTRVTSEGSSAASDHANDEMAGRFNPLGPSDDPVAVAELKANEITHARLTMIYMLVYYVQALVTSEGPSAASGHATDELAERTNPRRYTNQFYTEGTQRPTETTSVNTTRTNVDASNATNKAADVSRDVGTHDPYHFQPQVMSPRYASHPNIQPAVRSPAPRPDTDNQPPDTTDRTENNTTAVRSLAPRPWHATVRLNKTTSWRPRPLCYIGLMTHIILLLLHNGDGGVEPCSPPANTTDQTTYQNIMTHYGMANSGAERRSPPTMPTMTTVRSPAPRPCHYPNHTVTAAQFSAQELHRRPDIHPVLHVTPLPSHTPHCSRTRNCRNTAFSQRSTPPSQPHPAWRCRSVIVSGAGPPVCLPATGSVKGIKHALHHLTPHLPPPQHRRLFYQGQLLGDHDPTPTTTTTGPIHLTLRLVGLKGGGRRSRRDTDSDSTSDSDSDSHSRRKKSRKRSSKGELTQALRAMTSLADSVAGICRSIQPQQTVTPEAPAPQRSTDRYSDQARTEAEPSQDEAAPQARRRYCVSIDTRQGERQVSLHEPGQQPQHSPLCPPTPVAEPLRFYRNPHSPEVPCAVPALQHGHGDVSRQPLPQQAATRMEHMAAQPVYHSEPLRVPQTQHEPQAQYRAATRMEHTVAEPVYHSEPLYVPQTQHEPQVQYRAVVDRHGQHILPEDTSGTWARFSEQNAAALEILQTEPPMLRHTDAEPATGYLDMWLSRDRTRPLADPHAPRRRPTDTPDEHPVHQPGPPQIHGERAPWRDAHAEQAPEQGPEPSGWGQAGVFPFTGGWDVVAAQQAQQAPPRQPRGRRRRPRTHKGELGTVIPNIPTIPPPDQRDTASPDVLVCAYICMRGTAGACGYLPNTCLAPFSTVTSGNGQPGTDRVDRTVTARWQVGRKDFAPQACTLMTGAAGTHSAGTLATAYQAAVYLSGYTGVGAFFATGDARHADQQRTAQDGQTRMSYMAPTRPSTVRVQTDGQRAAKATGRVNVPACRPCVGMAGATGTYPAGPLATDYSPALHTGVGALDAPGDAQSADQRQAVHDNQTGMSYMAPNRPSVRGGAAQAPTDGQRTGQAPATMTRIHAFPGSDPFVVLPQYREEPPYPSGHPPPPHGRNASRPTIWAGTPQQSTTPPRPHWDVAGPHGRR